MRTKPIIFNTFSVQCILDGHKTQTRRILKSSRARFLLSDLLWVKEAWGTRPEHDHLKPSAIDPNEVDIFYKADEDVVMHGGVARWRTPLYMPKILSRLELVVRKVKVDRLQSITDADAEREGCYEYTMFHVSKPSKTVSPREHFRQVWDSLNPKPGYNWDSDPMVWVIDFTLML